MFLLDSHCDTPGEILRGRDLLLDNIDSHVDFPKLRRGGVDAAFFALYVPASLDTEQAYEHAMKLYKGIQTTVEAYPDKAAFALTRSQAHSNKSEGLFSIFLGLENGSPIGESLNNLKYFYARIIPIKGTNKTKWEQIKLIEVPDIIKKDFTTINPQGHEPYLRI